jgi:CheY-like chemotaxis protein/GGDEF domain-containing protein
MRAELGPSLPLSVIAIVTDGEAIDLISRTLANSGDHLSVATDLAEGLTRVTHQVPDVALVDVTLGDSAGLAVLHHIRALAPSSTVFALTRPERLELGTQAMALGGSGMLVLPLAGDELLTALAEVRTRLAERAARVELERMAVATRKDLQLLSGLAEICEATSRREAAVWLSRVLADVGGAQRVLVYLPAGEGSRELMRAAESNGGESPSFCEDMELLVFAAEQKLEVLRLQLRRELGGIVLVDGLPATDSGLEPSFINTIGSQAATVFALINAREQSHRASMKDPRSSAYTFAYFVDVAGREIDMARRHKRRFALMTIGVAGKHEISSEREPTIDTADRVLSAVRDTDVLARVDANEFYLLLPETGGLGAHSCRRRVLEQLGGVGEESPYELAVGLATYPHDGGDLSRLLRVARHRAEASRGSVLAKQSLRRLSLPELVDHLVLAVSLNIEPATGLIESPRYIELPIMDVAGLVLSAVQEAARGGAAQVAVTRHSGVSMGSAMRSDLVREGDGLAFETVDVGGVPNCQNLEVLAIVSEHGSYALLGRSEGNLVRAVHAADPMLVDLVLIKLGEAAGTRLFE